MPLKIEFFPEGLILLNEELASGYHPTLEKKLAKHPPDEWEIRLAEIASHCSVALDGIYPKEQISELAAILSGRLQVMREFVAPQQIIGFDSPVKESSQDVVPE